MSLLCHFSLYYHSKKKQTRCFIGWLRVTNYQVFYVVPFVTLRRYENIEVKDSFD